MKRLALGIALLTLTSCGGSGGSSSGGGYSPPERKDICQACTYDSDCKSNRCVRFKSGINRCVPQNVTGYNCPGGMYKLPEGGLEEWTSN